MAMPFDRQRSFNPRFLFIHRNERFAFILFVFHNINEEFFRDSIPIRRSLDSKQSKDKKDFYSTMVRHFERDRDQLENFENSVRDDFEKVEFVRLFHSKE